jgi:hypothetical protein
VLTYTDRDGITSPEQAQGADPMALTNELLAAI